MQTKIVNDEGVTKVQVIDPTDGAVTHERTVDEGQQVIVTATSAQSPADIEVSEVEATPEAPEPTDEGAAASAGEAGEQAEDASPTGEAEAGSEDAEPDADPQD